MNLNESEAVRWIRYCSVSDTNWKAALPRLTDEELAYCYRWERRTTGRKQLEAEGARRGLGTFFLQLLAEKTEEPKASRGPGWQDPPTAPDAPMNSAARGKLLRAGKRIFRIRKDSFGLEPYGIWELSGEGGWRKFGRYATRDELDEVRADLLMDPNNIIEHDEIGQILDIEPAKGDNMQPDQAPEVRAVEEVYALGRKEGDRALAVLESERFDCEAVGKIKAAKFNIKGNELLMYVTLFQVKQSKEYKKSGRTWEEFCRSVGESERSVDQVLSELSPILQKISAAQAEILGMPLSKIRYLGKSISASGAEITENAIVIAGQPIQIIPENKDEIEAAIDLMKETAEKERQFHAKQVEKLQKKVETIATEETKGLTAERDALVKEITRLKVFDPEDKDVSWSLDQMKQITAALASFTILCRKFILDDRISGEIELQAKMEQQQTIARRYLDDLQEAWDERFHSSFGEQI